MKRNIRHQHTGINVNVVYNDLEPPLDVAKPYIRCLWKLQFDATATLDTSYIRTTHERVSEPRRSLQFVLESLTPLQL